MSFNSLKLDTGVNQRLPLNPSTVTLFHVTIKMNIVAIIKYTSGPPDTVRLNPVCCVLVVFGGGGGWGCLLCGSHSWGSSLRISTGRSTAELWSRGAGGGGSHSESLWGSNFYRLDLVHLSSHHLHTVENLLLMAGQSDSHFQDVTVNTRKKKREQIRDKFQWDQKKFKIAGQCKCGVYLKNAGHEEGDVLVHHRAPHTHRHTHIFSYFCFKKKNTFLVRTFQISWQG